jgi:uncharacterized phage protein gp47/JayE
MGTYGILSTGFVKPTLAELKSDLGDAYKAIYGTPNLADDSVIGIRIGIMAKQLADAWEALETAYNAPFPATGDDVSFPSAMDLVGLSMLPAAKSVVTCQCSGSGVVIPANYQISNKDTQEIFELTQSVTIPTNGSVDGIFQALIAGPKSCAAGKMTNIVNTLTGWDTVNNTFDGTPGRNAETVAEARLRRVASLQVIGASAIDAIVARVLNEVPNVTKCMGFTNRTMVADSDGRPPKSNEILVVGGTDADIGAKLWECTAGGIELYGIVSVNVVDSQGNTQVVKYTKAVEVTINVEVTIVVYNAKTLPSNYVALIQDAVVAYGMAFEIGQDLIISRWVVPCYGIPGVDEVTIQHKKGSGAWETVDIVMAYNEKVLMVSGNSGNVSVLGGP